MTHCDTDLMFQFCSHNYGYRFQIDILIELAVDTFFTQSYHLPWQSSVPVSTLLCLQLNPFQRLYSLPVLKSTIKGFCKLFEFGSPFLNWIGSYFFWSLGQTGSGAFHCNGWFSHSCDIDSQWWSQQNGLLKMLTHIIQRKIATVKTRCRSSYL